MDIFSMDDKTKMLICASDSLQAQLLPWLDGVEACFANAQAIEQSLQTRLQTASTPIPVLVELDCLKLQGDYSTQLARLHVLSGHKPVLLAQRWQLDDLPDAALDQLFTVVSLPWAARSLQMLQRQLAAEASRLSQLAAHEHCLKQLLEENRHLRQRLKQESCFDPVTGMFHRRAFEARLEKEWRRAHRHGHPISAVAIRLQGLDPAEPQSQAFLSELRRRLEAVRASDIVARLDDNVYVLLLPLTVHEGAEALSTHFRTLLTRLNDNYGYSIHAGLATSSEIPRRHSDGQRFLRELLSACKEGARV